MVAWPGGSCLLLLKLDVSRLLEIITDQQYLERIITDLSDYFVFGRLKQRSAKYLRIGGLAAWLAVSQTLM